MYSCTVVPPPPSTHPEARHVLLHGGVHPPPPPTLRPAIYSCTVVPPPSTHPEACHVLLHGGIGLEGQAGQLLHLLAPSIQVQAVAGQCLIQGLDVGLRWGGGGWQGAEGRVVYKWVRACVCVCVCVGGGGGPGGSRAGLLQGLSVRVCVRVWEGGAHAHTWSCSRAPLICARPPPPLHAPGPAHVPP